EVAQLADLSKDNSLFSLLLLLEARLYGDAFDSKVRKSGTSALDPRSARFAAQSRYTQSRYIE
ncbi:MAG TPA: hypothetical protein VHY59_06895, partial [Chthoniobacterales bacterium]|nr:hypothetical protein [Chthoniobacterales bacterium]